MLSPTSSARIVAHMLRQPPEWNGRTVPSIVGETFHERADALDRRGRAGDARDMRAIAERMSDTRT